MPDELIKFFAERRNLLDASRVAVGVPLVVIRPLGGCVALKVEVLRNCIWFSKFSCINDMMIRNCMARP